jgi:hypothetical protein
MLIRLLFLSLFLNLGFSATVLAHAGVDHGDNCIINLSGFELSLGGFQAEEKIGGGKHYCHIFPKTGWVIFTFDELAKNYLQNKNLNLQFSAVESYWDILFDYDNAFTDNLVEAKDSLSIRYEFSQAGLYVLDITLATHEFEASINNNHRLFFLVGFPIIKLLIYTALGFLLMLIIIVGKQAIEKQAKKDSFSS